MTRVLISGEGGQGVRVISYTLATLLANLGYEVTLLYDYDSSVRGGMSMAHLTFGKEAIDNPAIDRADILLKLADKAGGLVAEKTVCEEGLCSDEAIPFSRLGMEHFGKDVFGNMIALGRLMALVGVDASEKDLAGVLPLKYRRENVSAVLFGYHLKQEDLTRGRRSTRQYESDFANPRPDDARAAIEG